jgi:hypothetical protein
VQFHLSCACGKSIEVSGSAAGSSVVCPCDRAVAVPSLSELRRQSGLPAFKASAALIIEEMKAARELPAPACVECCQHTEDKAVAVADCERAWGRGEDGGWMWGIAAVAVFFVGLWALLLYYLSRDRKEFGDTVIVQMPIRICHGCRGCLKRNLLIPILLVFRYAGLATGIVLLFFFPAVSLLVFAAVIGLFVVERALRRQYQKALKWRLERIPIYRRLLADYPNAYLKISFD